MANKKPEVPVGHLGLIDLATDSTGATVQRYTALGIPLAPTVKTTAFLWLAGQCGALLLIFIKRQTTTAQRFQGQLFGFFRRVGAQFG